MRLSRIVLAITFLLSGACTRANEPQSDPTLVVASFYPLAFVGQELSGALVELENLTPPGAEPHDLELTPGQIRALAAADLVVYVGDGFQPSIEAALRDIDATVVDVLAAQQDLLEPPAHEGEGEHEDESDHEEGEHGDEGTFDPHVWLDPVRLGEIATVVADELAEIDAGNAERFRANAAKLRSRLNALDAEFRRGLRDCERATIVTSHEAFGYLTEAYGLQEIGISGIDPEAEPSPRRLAEVAEFVRANDVTTVFFEVLVPPQTAETLAEEAGVETARLDPLEGPPQNGDYFTAMRANLSALREGLGCT